MLYMCENCFLSTELLRISFFLSMFTCKGLQCDLSKFRVLCCVCLSPSFLPLFPLQFATPTSLISYSCFVLPLEFAQLVVFINPVLYTRLNGCELFLSTTRERVGTAAAAAC